MASDAMAMMEALVLESGRRWGSVATPWQKADAEAVLEGPAPYGFWTRPRGGAKTSDLAGVTVPAMLTKAPPGSHLYAAAADRDQARLFIDSIRGYAVRTPELRGALRVDAYKVTAPGDVVLEALAADGPSTWGLRPFMLLIDEVCQWPSTPSTSMFYEALTSAILKMDGARMVLCSSAGDPVHWSRKVLDHALESELWRVSEVPGPLEWTDPVKLEEQQKRLPPSSFRRLHLNQWASAEDRLVDPDDLQACVTLEGPVAPEPGLKYVVGLDIGLRNDATVAAVLHKDRDGRLVLDRMEVWAPVKGQTVELSTVEAWLELTCRAYNHAEICFDPYQAIALSQRLRAQGIRTSEYQFTAASVGRLAVNLFQVLRERRLALTNDEALLDEFRTVRLRATSPGVLRIDHDAGRHDDRVIAVALAAQHLLTDSSGGGQRLLLPM